MYNVEEENLSRIFVDFGFDVIIKDDVQQPRCNFCSKVLENGSIKLSI